MQTTRPWRWLALLGLALALLMLVAGCGGGGGTKTPGSPTLVNPVEDGTKNGSIGGTVFTLAAASAADPTGIVDQAYNAEITITNLPGTPAFTATTRSTVRGGFTFPVVPPGYYRLQAEVANPRDPDIKLTGEIARVHVRGNIPTLMANVVLCDADNDAEVTGTVKLNGTAVEGATVTLYIIAHNLQYLEGDTTTYVPVVVATDTDNTGTYHLNVPLGASEYNVAAHSNASRLANQLLTPPAPGSTTTLNLVLSPAISPVFLDWAMDIVSVTLPQATPSASQQALITRLAVARALNAPPQRLAHLEKLRTLRGSGTTRAVGGFIENDLYWYSLSAPDAPYEYSGFHVYRGLTKSGTYTLMGSNPDPDGIYFYDNDPALNDFVPRYYTGVSYAANGSVSAPFAPVLAAPLARINVTGPADGASVKVGTAVIAWDAVPGAKSYLVTKFAVEPTYNAVSVGTMTVHPAGSTSEVLSGLGAGTYWYSVSAYNTEEPNYNTASTFSAFRTITLTP